MYLLLEMAAAFIRVTLSLTFHVVVHWASGLVPYIRLSSLTLC